MSKTNVVLSDDDIRLGVLEELHKLTSIAETQFNINQMLEMLKTLTSRVEFEKEKQNDATV